MRNMPGPHDIGGKNFGPVDRSEHTRTDWDDRVDAILKLMLAGRRFRIDELRRSIESLSEQDYMTLSYYQKWLVAMRGLMVEKGLLTEEDISRRLTELRKRKAA